ncbi:MAG TPA: outer membrane beta-barrel protein [Microvirga sp.]|nr:outer membrane beta-barrel protein [Microvirga sp.]
MQLKHYVSLAAALLGAPPVLAADLLESRRMAPTPALQAAAPAPALPRWSGFYAGVHAGGARADWDNAIGFVSIDCTPCSRGATTFGTFTGPGGDDTAVLGGVQAGYNLQSGSLLFGFEADWSLTDLGTRRGYRIPSASLLAAGLGAITGEPDGFTSVWRAEVDWLATARGRIGVTAGNLLFYATGGLAFADARTTVGFLALAPARSPDLIPVSASADPVRVGWTVGAGLEAAVSSDLSIKVEYLYADFGRDRQGLGYYIEVPSSLLQSAVIDEKLTLHSMKLGLNYRFPGL